MLIPVSELSDDAINGLAEDYLTSGADQYLGNLSTEVPKVAKLIRNGELVVSFSLADETIVLKNKNELFLGKSK